MAAQVGLSQTAVSRIWRAFGLQPHRQESFKLSKDPLFIEKVRDVVGLYLDPPERAVVLCVDEKSQIHARERGRALRLGRARRGRALISGARRSQAERASAQRSISLADFPHVAERLAVAPAGNLRRDDLDIGPA